MFGIDDALIGSVVGAGANIFGGILGSQGAAATNAQSLAMLQQEENFNANQAQINRDWQTQMSNTAWQRGVSDMKAAGINPILAASGGIGGASTPGGGAGSIGGVPSLQNPSASLAAGVSSAGQLAQNMAQIRVANTQADKDKSQTVLNDATKALNEQLEQKARQDTATSAAQQHQVETQSKNVEADTLNKAIQGMILGHNVTSAAGEARIRTREAEDTEKYGSSKFGQDVGSVIRMGRTAINNILDRGTPAPAATAPSGAAVGGSFGKSIFGGGLQSP